LNNKITAYIILPAFLLLGGLAMGVLSASSFTILLTLLMLVAIFREASQPSICAGGTLAILLLGTALKNFQSGSLTLEEQVNHLLSGFSSQTLITVAALFVVAEGIRLSGWLELASHKILSNERRENMAALRIGAIVTPLSSFMNNTPVVAMFIPAIKKWCCKNKVSSSKLLLPMVFFTTLGGMCTLIGTSTNLIVHGKMLELDPSKYPELSHGLNMFTLTPIALICIALGTIWIIAFAIKILPHSEDSNEASVRTYIMKMKITPASPIDGKRVKETNLQKLDGLVIMSASRPSGNTVTTNIRNWILLSGDILTFSGEREHLSQLQSISGLSHIELESDEDFHLYELLIPSSSALIGKSIQEIWFRQRYMAAALSLHRRSKEIHNFSDNPLQVGDTLLIAAKPTFIEFWRNSADFTLLSVIDEDDQEQVKPKLLPLIIVLLMSLLPAFNILPIMTSAMIAALLMIATRKELQSAPLKTIDLNILLVIGAALGLSSGLQDSGAAAMIANALPIPMANPQLALFGVCLFTWMLTELITNTAAVALIFPIAISIAEKIEVSPLPFIIAVAVAGSASFATPIGYQTNMMVYAPGNYKFSDYLKSGLPLALIVVITASLSIPFFFKF
jgi:di/tricarboxylate transporter